MSQKRMWTATIPNPDGTQRVIEIMFHKPNATSDEVLHRLTEVTPLPAFVGVNPSRIRLEGPYEPSKKHEAMATAILKNKPKLPVTQEAKE